MKIKDLHSCLLRVNKGQNTRNPGRGIKRKKNNIACRGRQFYKLSRVIKLVGIIMLGSLYNPLILAEMRLIPYYDSPPLIRGSY